MSVLIYYRLSRHSEKFSAFIFLLLYFMYYLCYFDCSLLLLHICICTVYSLMANKEYIYYWSCFASQHRCLCTGKGFTPSVRLESVRERPWGSSTSDSRS